MGAGQQWSNKNHKMMTCFRFVATRGRILDRCCKVRSISAVSLQDALAALREAQQPDTAAMFIIACREIHAEFLENLDADKDSDPSIKEKLLILPGFNPENEDVIAVGELYGQFRQKTSPLVHGLSTIFKLEDIYFTLVWYKCLDSFLSRR
uniref:uncharacterized protein LOC122599439 isoform X2 n=1 Tax=Erigeron canadensis TaxID=72917 RepID=UPI001CB8B6E2|nr:uncharacterized protein LOC122599439 isoform X2 [Erigeron canadensis]